MAYIEGFALPVPKDRLEDYKALARLARDIWLELGALDYVEAVEDDVPLGELTSFPRAVQRKDDEVVVFSWIVYADKARRDEISAKASSDPRFKIWEDRIPFDARRMIWGGFAPFVGLGA